MASELVAQEGDRILVTGSSGFIGTRVVAELLRRGFSNIACFVRPSSRTDRLDSLVREAGAEAKVQRVSGDLMSPADCARAAEGAAVIYHLAAGFDKSFAGAFMNSALATRNLLDAFLARGRPKRFVNVSSFAVYSNLTLGRGAPLDEDSPLEDSPQERYDAYGFGKLKQEEIVRRYGSERALPYVILRPGTVFGPGKKDLTGRIGIDTFGFFIHVGGSNVLPLTFVDNCAEAIVLAGLVPGVDGEVFNVVDDEPLTSSQFLRAYRRRVPQFFSVRVPYFMASILCKLWEDYSRRSQGQLPPAFNRRRCAAEWKGNRFSNAKLRTKLGWSPRIPMNEAMDRFLAQFPPLAG
ncbi:MAG: NAD-dependent epimerase/dehydratase family protein [Burkholderiales bacterium]